MQGLVLISLSPPISQGASKQRKTKVKFQTLEPQWEETFVFSGVHMDSTCVLTVYDHDIVGSHDFIGNVRHLPPPPLTHNQEA